MYVGLYYRLRTLNVSRTALTSIRDSPHRLHLETLILLETAIPSWTDIDALQNCTGGSLRSLRISLAGMEDVGDEATAAGTDKHTDSTRMTGIAKLDRPMLIAKLSGLTMLNLTPISLTERRDAEEWYVRHVLQLRDKGDTTTWGRYEELRVQHQPTLSVTGQPRPSNALKSKLISELPQSRRTRGIDVPRYPSILDCERGNDRHDNFAFCASGVVAEKGV